MSPTVLNRTARRAVWYSAALADPLNVSVALVALNADVMYACAGGGMSSSLALPPMRVIVADDTVSAKVTTTAEAIFAAGIFSTY
jgi:hypothetical protein